MLDYRSGVSLIYHYFLVVLAPSQVVLTINSINQLSQRIQQSLRPTNPCVVVLSKKMGEEPCDKEAHQKRNVTNKMKADQLTNSESRWRFNKSQGTSTSGARHLACHSRHAVGTVFRWPNGTVENGRFERKSEWPKTPLAPFFWKTSHKILLPVSLVGTGKLVLKETWKNQTLAEWNFEKHANENYCRCVFPFCHTCAFDAGWSVS